MTTLALNGEDMPSNQTEQAKQEQGKQEQDELAPFRESAEETVVWVEGLAPLCETLDDMVNMLKLALKNDSQMRLLIKQVSPLRFGK